MRDVPSGELGHMGGDVDRVLVTLRVFGDDLDPDDVTRVLGCPPTKAHQKGDRFPLSGGQELVRRTGSWRLEFPGAEQEWILTDAIDALLDRLPSDPAVWYTLASRFRLDVFCGLFLDALNRGLDLGPDVMSRLAERHLTLRLDIYSFEPDDEAI